jgi:hypothetical protein
MIQKVGSSTKYTYAYTGRYIAQVEVLNESTTANGRMVVKVISPDVVITNVGTDKYGSYVDITNNNMYELNLSQWRITFDGASFPFPKNTVVAASSTVRFGGQAMGFARIPITSSTTVKILFPHLEEVTRYTPKQQVTASTQALITQTNKEALKPKGVTISKMQVVPSKSKGTPQVLGMSTTTFAASSTKAVQGQLVHRGQVSQSGGQVKDTRLVAWMRGLFGR